MQFSLHLFLQHWSVAWEKHLYYCLSAYSELFVYFSMFGSETCIIHIWIFKQCFKLYKYVTSAIQGLYQ